MPKNKKPSKNNSLIHQLLKNSEIKQDDNQHPGITSEEDVETEHEKPEVEKETRQLAPHSEELKKRTNIDNLWYLHQLDIIYLRIMDAERLASEYQLLKAELIEEYIEYQARNKLLIEYIDKENLARLTESQKKLLNALSERIFEAKDFFRNIITIWTEVLQKNQADVILLQNQYQEQIIKIGQIYKSYASTPIENFKTIIIPLVLSTEELSKLGNSKWDGSLSINEADLINIAKNFATKIEDGAIQLSGQVEGMRSEIESYLKEKMRNASSSFLTSSLEQEKFIACNINQTTVDTKMAEIEKELNIHIASQDEKRGYQLKNAVDEAVRIYNEKIQKEAVIEIAEEVLKFSNEAVNVLSTTKEKIEAINNTGECSPDMFDQLMGLNIDKMMSELDSRKKSLEKVKMLSKETLASDTPSARVKPTSLSNCRSQFFKDNSNKPKDDDEPQKPHPSNDTPHSP